MESYFKGLNEFDKGTVNVREIRGPNMMQNVQLKF